MIVGNETEKTNKQKYGGETVFCDTRPKSLLHQLGGDEGGYALTPKIQWMDVPVAVEWLCHHIGKWEGGSNNSSYALGEALVRAGKTPKELKDALYFFNQHRYHVFTNFWKDGVCRWRMTKHEGRDLQTTYGKKGLARTIQDNRFYIHWRWDMDEYYAHAMASIPEIRMNLLKQTEGQNIQTMESMFQNCEKFEKRTGLLAEKVEEGTVVTKAINQLMNELMGVRLPPMLGCLFTGEEHYSWSQKTVPGQFMDGDEQVKPIKAFSDWKKDNIGANVLDPQKYNETHAKMNHAFMKSFLLWNAQAEKARKIEDKVREAILTILEEEMEQDE